MARRPTREAHRHPWARDGAIMSAPRLRMTCPACFSRDIAQEGCSALWSESRQEWLAGDPESHFCNACGREFDEPRQVELAEEKEAA